MQWTSEQIATATTTTKKEIEKENQRKAIIINV